MSKTLIITAAIIRQGDHILLVEQQAAYDAQSNWALPGGRLEKGETLLDALKREVFEETGLQIQSVGNLAYVAQVQYEAMQSFVFIYEVTTWTGAIKPADPDEVILQAAFLPKAVAIEQLTANPWPTMRDPIVAYLKDPTLKGSTWCYTVEGEEERLTSKFP